METLFPALRAMHNSHPLLLHFPIALFMTACVIQAIVVLGRREPLQPFASGLLYLGALSAPYRRR